MSQSRISQCSGDDWADPMHEQRGWQVPGHPLQSRHVLRRAAARTRPRQVDEGNRRLGALHSDKLVHCCQILFGYCECYFRYYIIDNELDNDFYSPSPAASIMLARLSHSRTMISALMRSVSSSCRSSVSLLAMLQSAARTHMNTRTR